jgi:hypothetical protein
MIHLRTIFALTIMGVGIAIVTSAATAATLSHESANAAQNSKSKAKSNPKSKNTAKSGANLQSGLAGQTDIVAKVDLPMVTNITPWRDSDTSIPKNILEFSVLKDSLTPTDRDRLTGEIRYTSILNQPFEQK